LLQGVAEKLGCASEDVVESAERAVGERDAHFKSARVALQRLAEAEATLTLQREPQGAGGLRVVAQLFQDEGDAEYLGGYASALAKTDGTVALLARMPCGHLIFAQHPSVGKDLSAVLKQVVQEFGGKGGGTRDFARGKLNDAALGEKALARAKELVGA
jgi:alanyl-tRNA synthetase